MGRIPDVAPTEGDWRWRKRRFPSRWVWAAWCLETNTLSPVRELITESARW